jgi:hypothetical protein
MYNIPYTLTAPACLFACLQVKRFSQSPFQDWIVECQQVKMESLNPKPPEEIGIEHGKDSPKIEAH